nr:immunoglobulin light chain junction region [Macaca mulatta]
DYYCSSRSSSSTYVF